MLFAFDILGLMKDGIITVISGGFRAIFFEICGFVYGFIINIYDVFISLTKAQLLEIDVISDIAQRIGLILGLVMFFMVSFSFIQMILDPEKISDKKVGAVNIVKKVVVVIVMFGMSPFVFNILQTVQNNVIDSGLVARLILPRGYNFNSDSFGKVLSANLFTAFYAPKDEELIKNDDDYENCMNDYNSLRNNIVKYGDFSSMCVAAVYKPSNDSLDFLMSFNYILSLVVGIGVCYFLVMYTISVGMRVIQLTFLQIISPMAFMAYLSPKEDNMFSKWTKVYISTYIDVFIRIAIISLGAFLISILMDSWNDINANVNGFGSVFWHSVADGDVVKGVLYIKIIMIMAILSFMKKAPDLLKQLFPSMGSAGILSLGVSAKDRPGVGITKSIVGGATAGVVGAGVSTISRFNANRANGKTRKASALAALGGGSLALGRGFYYGSKSGNVFSNVSKAVDSQRDIDNKYSNLVAQGGSNFGKFKSKVTDYFTETLGQRYDRIQRNINRMVDYKKQMNDAADEISFVKAAKNALDSVRQGDEEDFEHFNRRLQGYQDTYRNLRKAAQAASLQGVDSFVLNGETYRFDDDDDKSNSSRIKSVVEQAESYRVANEVQYYDRNSNVFVPLESITAGMATGDFDSVRSALSSVEVKANDTNTHISGDPEYLRARANDMAAGVSGRRNPDEKK